MFDVIEIVSYSSAYVDFLVFFLGGVGGKKKPLLTMDSYGKSKEIPLDKLDHL